MTYLDYEGLQRCSLIPQAPKDDTAMPIETTTTIQITPAIIPTPDQRPDQVIADLVKLLGIGRSVEALADGLIQKLTDDDAVSPEEFEPLERQLLRLGDWGRKTAQAAAK